MLGENVRLQKKHFRFAEIEGLTARAPMTNYFIVAISVCTVPHASGSLHTERYCIVLELQLPTPAVSDDRIATRILIRRLPNIGANNPCIVVMNRSIIVYFEHPCFLIDAVVRRTICRKSGTHDVDPRIERAAG